MDQGSSPMPMGLRISSWTIAIITIIACYVPIFLLGPGASLEADVGVDASAASDGLSDTTLNAFLVIIPLLQIINLVLGIITAARKDAGALPTTRAIMLTYKLALIPFFILGGVIELICIAGGFHPILVGFTWVIGFGLGVLGWLTVMSGSIWTIATAVKAKRSAIISSGECALYIAFSVFFVLDVVGSIILFARSRRQAACAQ